MKTLIAASAAVMLLAPSAQADALRVQLKGPGLAESAGYLLAEARNLYIGSGVVVQLLPPSDAPTLETLARGKADMVVEWMPAALLARENGLPVVNVAQITNRPTLRLACGAEAGVTDVTALRGKTVASWFSGTDLPLAGWMNRAGIPLDGSAGGITLVRQSTKGSEMLRQKQADCVSTRSFALPALPGVSVLDPAAERADTLEEGLYVLEPTLADGWQQNAYARFLLVSMEGWRAVAADPAGTARELLGPDPDEGALQQLTARLTALSKNISADGALNEAAYRRTVETLRAGKGVLKAAPKGATTRAVSDMAAGMHPGVDGDPARVLPPQSPAPLPAP